MLGFIIKIPYYDNYSSTRKEIYKGKEDELRLHLRREHLFGYDISKRKEVKAL